MMLRTHVAGEPLGTLSARERWLLPARGNPYIGAEVPQGADLPGAEAVRAARREKGWIRPLTKLSETAGVPVLADYYRSRARVTVALPAGGDSKTGDPRDRLDALSLSGGLSLVGAREVAAPPPARLVRAAPVPGSEYPGCSPASSACAHRVLATTYGDVARVLQLTDEQIGGLWLLGPSAHHESDVTGLRALLAIVAEPALSGRRISVSLFISNEPSERSPLRYAQMSRRQRSCGAGARRGPGRTDPWQKIWIAFRLKSLVPWLWKPFPAPTIGAWWSSRRCS